jgi:hypothetical protein
MRHVTFAVEETPLNKICIESLVNLDLVQWKRYRTLKKGGVEECSLPTTK